jgi:hypothetical protein
VPGAARETAQESAKAATAPDQIDAMVEKLYQAALQQDDRAMDAVAGDYLQSPQGTAWWREIQQYSQAMQVPEPALAYQGQPAEPAMATAPLR